MRILFLADAVFMDLPGGSRVAARELAKGLINKGHDVTFLVGKQSFDAPSKETAKDYGSIIRYEGAGTGLDFIRNGQIASAKLWSEGPFDIVHTHFAYASVGPLRSIPRQVPRVRTFHGPWDEEAYFEDMAGAKIAVSKGKAFAKIGLRWLVERQNLQSSSAIITLSDCFKKKVRERYGVVEIPISVIHGGADLDRFMPATNKTSKREQLNLPTDRRILLSVRRLAPRMGLDQLVLAMPKILEQNPDVLLLIGGKGPQKAQLEQIIIDRGLQNHVTLVGFIPDELLAAYYQSADLFVLPTTALEGFGLVTTEALACGLPVIGTPVGATPEILSGISPKLVSGGCGAEHLAAAVNEFLGTSLKNELTPDMLHHYVCENFNWNNHINSVETLYQKMAAV